MLLQAMEGTNFPATPLDMEHIASNLAEEMNAHNDVGKEGFWLNKYPSGQMLS